jgi:hypothetical protein
MTGHVTGHVAGHVPGHVHLPQQEVPHPQGDRVGRIEFCDRLRLLPRRLQLEPR